MKEGTGYGVLSLSLSSRSQEEEVKKSISLFLLPSRVQARRRSVVKFYNSIVLVYSSRMNESCKSEGRGAKRNETVSFTTLFKSSIRESQLISSFTPCSIRSGNSVKKNESIVFTVE